ncbi:MAG: HEAT repeat domain-containing protein, partial [Fibrobacterota bacterium]
MDDTEIIKILKSGGEREISKILSEFRNDTETGLKFIGYIIKLRHSRISSIRRDASDAASFLMSGKLLNDPDSLTESTVSDFLGALNKLDPSFFEKLSHAVKDKTSKNRFEHLHMLAESGPKAARVFSSLVWDPDSRIRATAVKLLGEVSGNADYSRIIKFLYDKDPRVIANTIETIEKIGNRNLTGVLGKYRDHPDNRVRANALKAYWTLGHREIFDDIRKMLRDPDELMAASAVWLIGEIACEDESALVLFEEASRNSGPLVRYNIAKAAKRIGSEKALKIAEDAGAVMVNDLSIKARERLHRLKFEKDERRRATMVKMVGKLLGPSDFLFLSSFLEDEDKRV